MHSDLLTAEFRALSARLGSDPLQVQGPGGNTSIKKDNIMWIKASGTELANADTENIFVAVDRSAAQDELRGIAGDGSCKSTVLDKSNPLRPSIETTFHAALEHAVVVHTHSIATLTHVLSDTGCNAAAAKLDGIAFAIVPYAKPGLPLTQKIVENINSETCVVLLRNHGLICAGPTVNAVSKLTAEVENRLAMPVLTQRSSAAHALQSTHKEATLEGYELSDVSWMAFDERAFAIASSGSYYPDHVVFLGPALPTSNNSENPPAIIIENQGVFLRNDATASQRAMLTCLSDVLSRLPEEWTPQAIGTEAEAALLNWDAEKYRQALAKRQ